MSNVKDLSFSVKCVIANLRFTCTAFETLEALPENFLTECLAKFHLHERICFTQEKFFVRHFAFGAVEKFAGINFKACCNSR